MQIRQHKVWFLDGTENWQYRDIFVFDHWFGFNLGRWQLLAWHRRDLGGFRPKHNWPHHKPMTATWQSDLEREGKALSEQWTCATYEGLAEVMFLSGSGHSLVTIPAWAGINLYSCKRTLCPITNMSALEAGLTILLVKRYSLAIKREEITRRED